MRARNGFTLTELLVAMVVGGIVISGVIGFFTMQRRLARQEAVSAMVDDSLRIGLTRIADHLRDAGYGAPTTELDLWVPWVDGFTSNPNVRQGTGGAPDAIDIAACRPGGDSVLSATAVRGVRTLQLDDADLVDAGRRRLLNVGGLEPVLVTATGGGTHVDSDPGTGDAQGLARTHFAGTPVCRVDVISFAVDTAAERLIVDRHDGRGSLPLLDHVIDLQIVPLAPGRRYRVSLTARSRQREGSFAVTRSASTLVAVRN